LDAVVELAQRYLELVRLLPVLDPRVVQLQGALRVLVVAQQRLLRQVVASFLHCQHGAFLPVLGRLLLLVHLGGEPLLIRDRRRHPPAAESARRRPRPRECETATAGPRTLRPAPRSASAGRAGSSSPPPAAASAAEGAWLLAACGRCTPPGRPGFPATSSAVARASALRAAWPGAVP